MRENDHPLQAILLRKHSVKNEEGYTLIELLAALSISTLFVGMIGSVIYFGLNTYEKAVVENQLRDEADYYVTRIMEELYEFSPDYIEDNEDGSITAFRFQDISIGNNGVLTSGKGKKEQAKMTISFSDEDQDGIYDITITHEGDSGGVEVLSDSTAIQMVQSEGVEPYISASFSEDEELDKYREAGQIRLVLFLQNDSVGPYQMESTFGF